MERQDWVEKLGLNEQASENRLTETALAMEQAEMLYMGYGDSVAWEFHEFTNYRERAARILRKMKKDPNATPERLLTIIGELLSDALDEIDVLRCEICPAHRTTIAPQTTKDRIE